MKSKNAFIGRTWRAINSLKPKKTFEFIEKTNSLLERPKLKTTYFRNRRFIFQ